MKSLAIALLPLLVAGPALAPVPPAAAQVAPDRETAGDGGAAVGARNAPSKINPTWRQVSTGESPGELSSATMAYDSTAERTVLFGGRLSESPYDMVSTTWAWDGSNWEQLRPGSHPSAREWHAMAYDPVRDELVMFGGYDGDTTGDTWIFHDGTWSRTERAASPSPRYGHLMAFDPALQQVILFGGFTGDGGDFMNDTWAWDGSTWTELHPSNSPSPRARGQLAYDPARGRLVTFGGQTWGANEDDTWSWDGRTWAQEPTRKTPTARFGYGLSTLGRHVVMYGGLVDHSPAGDTWILKRHGWRTVHPAGPWPWDRWNTAMAWDSARRKAVLFGGAPFVDDTWTLKP